VSLNKKENLLNKETKEENKRTEFENISTSIYGKGVIEQVNEDICEKNKDCSGNKFNFICDLCDFNNI
jgi:hypothetical protein